MFNKQDMTVGAWIAFYFLMCIPLVNLVTWLVLLLGGGTNKSLKNLLLAQILFVVIGTVFFIMFGAAFVAAMADYTV